MHYIQLKLTAYQMKCLSLLVCHTSFLADRTNGRAIATLLRLSVVIVCYVMYCA